MQIKRFLAAAAAASLAATGGTALAQTYPDKVVRLVSPYAPGGSNDLTARIISQRLGETLGQQVIVENKPGAATQIGSQFVAKSAPDGYTLLLAAATHTTNPSLFAKLPYDTLKDFTPVVLAATVPTFLIVNDSVPAKTVGELVAYAKKNPGKLNFGSAGNGSAPHLALELFKQVAGIDIVHVPFKGSAPAMAAVLSGDVQGSFETYNVFQPHLKAGKVRALAVTTPKRTVQEPDVPTLAESGFPGFEAYAWFSVLAPAGTPRAVVDRLNTEVNRVLALPEVKEQYAKMGLIPGGGTPAELDAFIRADIAKWSKVIKAAGIKPD
jgi:tripartite-type tricarboxylate transporter receptor subunit TctC